MKPASRLAWLLRAVQLVQLGVALVSSVWVWPHAPGRLVVLSAAHRGGHPGPAPAHTPAQSRRDHDRPQAVTRKALLQRQGLLFFTA